MVSSQPHLRAKGASASTRSLSPSPAAALIRLPCAAEAAAFPSALGQEQLRSLPPLPPPLSSALRACLAALEGSGAPDTLLAQNSMPPGSSVGQPPPGVLGELRRSQEEAEQLRKELADLQEENRALIAQKDALGAEVAELIEHGRMTEETGRYQRERISSLEKQIETYQARLKGEAHLEQQLEDLRRQLQELRQDEGHRSVEAEGLRTRAGPDSTPRQDWTRQEDAVAASPQPPAGVEQRRRSAPALVADLTGFMDIGDGRAAPIVPPRRNTVSSSIPFASAAPPLDFGPSGRWARAGAAG